MKEKRKQEIQKMSLFRAEDKFGRRQMFFFSDDLRRRKIYEKSESNKSESNKTESNKTESNKTESNKTACNMPESASCGQEGGFQRNRVQLELVKPGQV